MADLSDKQKLFVERYLISLNATKAAKEAGYSEKTAYRIGFENLKKPQIAELIEQKRKEARKRNEVSLDKIIDQYSRIALNEASKFLKVDEEGNLTADFAGASQNDLTLLSYETDGRKDGVLKIKPHDPHKALEMLGKHLGLGEKSKEEAQDRLTLALIEISKQGSAAPIATARRREQE